MANERNLIPVTKRTPREQKEISSKGGKASAKAKKQRKTMKEQMQYLLDLPIQEGGLKAQLQAWGIEPNELNMQMAMNASMIQNALKGSVNAYNSIRELMGERVQEVKVQQVTDENINYIDEYIRNAREKK